METIKKVALRKQPEQKDSISIITQRKSSAEHSLKDQLQLTPVELKQRNQWVVWRSEQRDGTTTKVPYTAIGQPASSNDPKTWLSFQDNNLPVPFHVWMRQAIEEGFILDVLNNYTPYSLAFKLANDGKEWDQTEVQRSEAMKGIMRWVRLHPYNIAQKVQVVVERFRENVAPLLNGQAKAVVVARRSHL